jgi:hypothetical protein
MASSLISRRTSAASAELPPSSKNGGKPVEGSGVGNGRNEVTFGCVLEAQTYGHQLSAVEDEVMEADPSLQNKAEPCPQSSHCQSRWSAVSSDNASCSWTYQQPKSTVEVAS